MANADIKTLRIKVAEGGNNTFNSSVGGGASSGPGMSSSQQAKMDAELTKTKKRLALFEAQSGTQKAELLKLSSKMKDLEKDLTTAKTSLFKVFLHHISHQQHARIFSPRVIGRGHCCQVWYPGSRS